MVGQPKYKYGDIVKFYVDGKEKVGEIKIIDAYGTFFQTEEPSYDILVTEENCLYKHFRESKVTLR